MMLHLSSLKAAGIKESGCDATYFGSALKWLAKWLPRIISAHVMLAGRLRMHDSLAQLTCIPQDYGVVAAFGKSCDLPERVLIPRHPNQSTNTLSRHNSPTQRRATHLAQKKAIWVTTPSRVAQMMTGWQMSYACRRRVIEIDSAAQVTNQSSMLGSTTYAFSTSIANFQAVDKRLR